MANLVHLIYASRAVEAFSEEQILLLLANARGKNQALGITGMLLFDHGDFLQVLEGEEDTVHGLFAHISRDSRHQGMVKIVDEAVRTRQFDNWSMGYRSCSREDLNTIEGMNDFFDGNSCLLDLDPGRAKKILTAFAKGRWRLG